MAGTLLTLQAAHNACALIMGQRPSDLMQAGGKMSLSVSCPMLTAVL